MTQSSTIEINIPTSALKVGDPSIPETFLDWTFAKCIAWVVDSHPAFNTTGPGIRQGARILDAIMNAEVGGKSKPLSREDVQALDAALNEPPRGYCPPLGNNVNGEFKPTVVPNRIFLSYLDAVADALKPAPSE